MLVRLSFRLACAALSTLAAGAALAAPPEDLAYSTSLSLLENNVLVERYVAGVTFDEIPEQVRQIVPLGGTQIVGFDEQIVAPGTLLPPGFEVFEFSYLSTDDAQPLPLFGAGPLFDTFGPPGVLVPGGFEVEARVNGLWWDQGTVADVALFDVVVTWDYVQGFDPIGPLGLGPYPAIDFGFTGSGTKADPLDLWLRFEADVLFGDTCNFGQSCVVPIKVDASDLHFVVAVTHVPVPAAGLMLAPALLLIGRRRRR